VDAFTKALAELGHAVVDGKAQGLRMKWLKELSEADETAQAAAPTPA